MLTLRRPILKININHVTTEVTEHYVDSIQCWMEDTRLVQMASEVLVTRARIRVTGSLYNDPGSPPMVIVRRIQP
jgi:hypothetical protein